MTQTILIVDDDDMIRELVAYILQMSQYAVVEATDGQDALHKLNYSNIDLIITDLRMPIMDGLELIQSLRNNRNYKGIPIILYSADIDNAFDAINSNARADKYLNKTTNTKTLLAHISQLISPMAYN